MHFAFGNYFGHDLRFRLLPCGLIKGGQQRTAILYKLYIPPLRPPHLRLQILQNELPAQSAGQFDLSLSVSADRAGILSSMQHTAIFLIVIVKAKTDVVKVIQL